MLSMRNVKLLARETGRLPGGAQEETDYSLGLSWDRAGPGSTIPGLTAGQLLAGSKSLRPWNQGFLAVPVVTGEALKGSKAEPQVLLLAMTLM